MANNLEQRDFNSSDYTYGTQNSQSPSLSQNVKTILFFGGLLLLSIVSCMWSGSSSREKNAIRKLLIKNYDLNSKFLLQEPSGPSQLWGNNKILNDYADNLSKYTTEARNYAKSLKLPNDFFVAYNKYLDSIEEYADVVRNHPNYDLFVTNALNVPLKGLPDPSSGSVVDMQNWINRMQQKEKENRALWDELLSIVTRYGVAFS